MTYSIVIDIMAIQDVQKAINFYDEQQPGLGKKFEGVLDQHLQTLSKNPHFRVYYDNIHCLPLKKYPFMVHFTIDEKRKVVEIRAVFHTSLNPDLWKLRK